MKIIEKPENHTAAVSAKATVLDSYFKGSYWLIEADFDGQIVFFNHATDLKNDAKIKLSFEPYIASH
ncbi:MAG: iron(III) transport system ATP-binding protein [Mariniflexile sp.]